MNTFTIEHIQETETYKALKNKKEFVKCNFLENKKSREKVTHAFTVYNNRGFIPNTLRHDEYGVVNDLIELNK